ncbi:hypothetical protein RKE38_10595 [Phycicoccus sp. M110.8]|uniref:hypothetical protein n=1 Tax=Phycicoccus sp. M110.8 TaxID=3075433 RepID=UPI0028FDB4B4|nr:hypothetical protein [Phycicoccus sp. M110.8]MDU0314134.1 hypothetical protein [Phycicoccus sp. M110.8]HET8768409.1 hypothetical protein [Pedococcus sp.]
MTDNDRPRRGAAAPRKTAGAFDIRNIIGLLLGIYGVLLLFAGFFLDRAEEKTGGVNANLWTGLGLAVAAAVFLGWARLRPIVVPEHVEPAEPDPTRPGPTRRGH